MDERLEIAAGAQWSLLKRPDVVLTQPPTAIAAAALARALLAAQEEIARVTAERDALRALLREADDAECFKYAPGDFRGRLAAAIGSGS